MKFPPFLVVESAPQLPSPTPAIEEKLHPNYLRVAGSSKPQCSACVNYAWCLDWP